LGGIVLAAILLVQVLRNRRDLRLDAICGILIIGAAFHFVQGLTLESNRSIFFGIQILALTLIYLFLLVNARQFRLGQTIYMIFASLSLLMFLNLGGNLVGLTAPEMSRLLPSRPLVPLYEWRVDFPFAGNQARLAAAAAMTLVLSYSIRSSSLRLRIGTSLAALSVLGGADYRMPIFFAVLGLLALGFRVPRAAVIGTGAAGFLLAFWWPLAISALAPIVNSASQSIARSEGEAIGDLNGRLELWKEIGYERSSGDVLDSAFGVGWEKENLAAYGEVFRAQRIERRSDVDSLSAHSSSLQQTLATGWLGLVLLGSIVTITVRRVLRLNSDASRVLLAMVGVLLGAAGTDSYLLLSLNEATVALLWIAAASSLPIRSQGDGDVPEVESRAPSDTE